MIRFSLFALAFILLQACSAPQQQPAYKDTFSSALATPPWYDAAQMDTVKVLSWNVEHFVDDFDNPYIGNRREDERGGNMEERRQLLAQAIKSINADIVVFQEFESDSYAQQLAEEYWPELGYQVFAGHESNDWYMNVVIMSRIPLGMFYSFATSNTPIVGQKDDEGNPESQTFINNRMWSVDVMVNPEYEFNLTGVHLKAGRGERNQEWRRGQINVLRAHYNRLTHLNPEVNLLAVGDFNAVPDSPEFMTFLGEDTETVQFVDRLKNTQVYSHPADSAFWRIDHILPNTNMNREVIPESVKPVYVFSPDTMERIADHLPMIVHIIPADR
ncbi:MAG: endonuclease/exonuclease/phosphatase family protein [Bacteroidota bacterium]